MSEQPPPQDDDAQALVNQRERLGGAIARAAAED